MNNNQELQDQITILKRDFEALQKSFYQNNFLSSQDFNKYSRFNSRLKVPSYSTDPDTCEQGEVIEVGGKLKICSATDTWTVVGAQTA